MKTYLLCISPSGTEFGEDLWRDVSVGLNDPTVSLRHWRCLAGSDYMVGVPVKSQGTVSSALYTSSVEEWRGFS